MNLAFIPSPSISSFNIGPVTIRFYALAILIGLCVAVWLTTVRWKKLGGSFDQIIDVTLITVPSGIIGARLYHVFTTPELYFGKNGNLGDILRIWNGGLGIWGAVVLGSLAVWAWCRYKKYSMALLMDAVAPGLLIAQGIGRLGNWFNQELYGAPTTLPWGLKLNSHASAIGSTQACYDGTSCPSLYDNLYHPTFLYEMLWNFLGAGLLLWLGSKITARFKAGTQFALYVMWYTAGRTWIEMLRIDRSHEFLGLRLNVWVALLTFIIGVIAFVVIQKRNPQTSNLQTRLAHVTELENKVASGDLTSRQLRAQLDEESLEEKRELKQKQAEDLDQKKIHAEVEKSLYEQAKALVASNHENVKHSSESQESEESSESEKTKN